MKEVVPLKPLELKDLPDPQRLIHSSRAAQFSTIATLCQRTPTTSNDFPNDQPIIIVVNAMVVDIDINHKIWYKSCKQCPKSMESVTDYTQACQLCSERPITVIPRYKLAVTIDDSTSRAKITVFDKEAQVILHKRVESIIQLVDEPGGLQSLQRQINKAIGSAYTFIVKITHSNLQCIARSGYIAQAIEWIPRKSLILPTDKPCTILTAHALEQVSVLAAKDTPSCSQIVGESFEESFVQLSEASDNSDSKATST